jgi:hypothetical protein
MALRRKTIPSRSRCGQRAGARGTFRWDIMTGSDKVKLNNGGSDSDTIIASNDNDVLLKSTAGSYPLLDVTVSFTWNGIQVCLYRTTVFTPGSLNWLSYDDFIDSGYGYESRISYAILDQFGTIFPNRDIEIHEEWTTGVEKNYSGTTWRRGPAGGLLAHAQNWYDGIQGEQPGYTPSAQNPQSSLGTTKVENWGQRWHVGSMPPGQGVVVQNNTLQKYRDHARNE